MKNKGITLIALVITIIIMLILVAVTVSYTVKSDLIGKTSEARAKYEEETINEIVGASIVYKITATTITENKYIDIPKTSVEIYKNLNASGFVIPQEKTIENVKDEDGTDLGRGIKIESNKINLTVIGEYGEYSGEITAKGITKKVAKIEKKNEPSSRRLVLKCLTKEDSNEICQYLEKCGAPTDDISSFTIYITNKGKDKPEWSINFEVEDIYVSGENGNNDFCVYMVPDPEDPSEEAGIWYRCVATEYIEEYGEWNHEPTILEGKEANWPNIYEDYTYSYENEGKDDETIFTKKEDAEGYIKLLLSKLLVFDEE